RFSRDWSSDVCSSDLKKKPIQLTNPKKKSMIRKLYRCFVVSVLLFFASVLTYAQTNTVTGTIKDDAGMAMPGVNVLIKGTTNGRSEERRVGKECTCRW